MSIELTPRVSLGITYLGEGLAQSGAVDLFQGRGGRLGRRRRRLAVGVERHAAASGDGRKVGGAEDGAARRRALVVRARLCG